jgi:DNA modification methylase
MNEEIDWLRPFKPDDTQQTYYKIQETIKSPLNFLMYNVNSIFYDDYPAKMPEDFARDMIRFYSKVGDIVYDGFCGSGTVPRVANKLGRIGLGSDINPAAIDLCTRHDPQNADRYFVQDLKTVKLEKKANLIVSSPPFGISIAGDKNNYSNEKDDLSNSKSIEDFLEKIKPCFQAYYNNLVPNGLLILDSRDRTKNSFYYDLSRLFANICVEIGFKVHAVYHYFLMPWQLYTYRNKENNQIIPNVSFIDVYVFYKPKHANSLLD